MIKDAFHSLVTEYSTGETANYLWKEIASHYNKRGRHYHNLTHLENMLTELEGVRSKITDWSTILVALVYHDIIYKATSKDNEEKSAIIATAMLTQLHFPSDQIKKVEEMILATKSHTVSTDSDINLFTDADLSILGKPWPVYAEYLKNIRKEYSIYPNFLYNPGRKKVLQHFLSMTRIYKTEVFFRIYEDKARSNMTNELELL